MNNRAKKNRKCTHMSAACLRQIRLELGFDMRSMARVLDGMPYRTYQDYEYDRRGIPKHVADAVRNVQRRNRRFMAALPGRVAARIDRLYPDGIPSMPSSEEE